MRDYIFHGKSKRTGEWVEGNLIWMSYLNLDGDPDDVIAIQTYSNSYEVHEESVGQYTGMNEFMLADETRNAKLFEGDIVEVWGWRVPVSTYNPKSQSDGRIKVRAVIYFKHGQWHLNYDNEYNKALAKLKGKEIDRRVVDGSLNLYYYGYHGSNIEGYRAKELEWYRRFHNKEEIIDYSDIVKIGNVYDNADLLEG